jgi:long-chain acyl-CoA synthetase
MNDRFHWHPKARLFDSAGDTVPRAKGTGTVLPDNPQGLAQALDLNNFRIGAEDQPPPEPTDRPALETLTSGSTGRPRRILRSQASWTASFAVNAGLGIGPGARVGVLGRLIQSLSLYGAIEGLHLGAEVHLLADLRPDRQLKALAARGITHLYATPAQLRLLVEGHGACPDLRLVLVGGSKLDPALRAAVRSIAPGATIREFYGAAETSFITLSDPSTSDASVGRAYPGVELLLDPGGEVWVRSPYLFEAYASDPGGARWRDGWLSVGEVGRLKDGYLFLRGRAGRMVTVADQNVFPEEIEAMIQAEPGIRRAAVLPVADARRGHVLVAILQGDAAVEARVRAGLRRNLGPLRAPKSLIWLEDWPLLPSGKTDLKALEARLPWSA